MADAFFARAPPASVEYVPAASPLPPLPPRPLGLPTIPQPATPHAWQRELPLPYVVTLETSGGGGAPRHPRAAAFIDSATARGWPVVVVGKGEPWPHMNVKAQLLADGLRALLNAGRSRDDLVVVSDARDVLCTRRPDDMREAYWEAGRPPIWASAEMLCNSRLQWYAEDGDGVGSQCFDPSRYWAARGGRPPRCMRPFVNAGLVLGRLGALHDMWAWSASAKVARPVLGDDQYALGAWATEHPQDVVLDVDARVLHTSTSGAYFGLLTLGEKPLCERDRAWAATQADDAWNYNELCGRSSFFTHFPGIEQHSMQRMSYERAAAIVACNDEAALPIMDEWGSRTYIPAPTSQSRMN